MKVEDGHWDGHFYAERGKDTLITACGVEVKKGTRIIFGPGRKCAECLAMLSRTMNWQNGEELLREGFYVNANGYAVAVVAVVRPFVDWTAYVGGCNLTQHEEDAVRWIARYGAKLPYEHAHHFFPDLPWRLYRS